MCRYHSWGAVEDGSFEGSSCEANIKSVIENIEYEFLLWLWEAGGFNEHCSEEAIMVCVCCWISGYFPLSVSVTTIATIYQPGDRETEYIVQTAPAAAAVSVPKLGC